MFRYTMVCKGLMVAFGGSALLAAASATAQPTHRVEITGSNIKRVDSEGPQPIVTIKREDIERSGKSTVNELLSSLPVISGGSFSENTSSGNSFAPGTAAVSLRGLGSNTTLTLLNGRRLANYGFAQNLNEGFVDLNSIPLAAIDRIEVLKDGASAIYGSDAISGVINVILRKDFRGVEAAASYGASSQGDANETRASIAAGVGDVTVNRFNAMVTFDYFKREATAASARPFSSNADNRTQGPGGFDARSPTGNPGYWYGNRVTGSTSTANATAFSNCPADRVVPGNSLGLAGGTTCAFDFTPSNKLTPDTERLGLFGRGVFQLNNDWQLFGEATVSQNKTGKYSAPTPAAFAVNSSHPDLPAGSTFNRVGYRFVEVGDRLGEITTDSYRAVAGVKGHVAGFDLEAAVMKAESKTLDSLWNYVIQERASEAFLGTLAGYTGTYYRVINPSLNAPDFVRAITIDPKRTGNSKLDSFDFKLGRELFALPGGTAMLAAGLEYRKESVEDNPDPRVALSNPNRVSVSGSGGTAVSGGRNLTSTFVEVSLPALKNVEVQLALRSDDYSDFGRATTPKVGISFRPASNFLIRAGFAEGFRAPSMAEQHLGESISFPSVRDTPRCNAYKAGYGNTDPRTMAICGGATGTGATAQVRTRFLGAVASGIALKPEESESFSVGFVFEPVKDLTIAVDGYHIDHTNRILSPTASFILANESQFPAGAVVRNPQSADDAAINAPGSLRGVSGDLTAGITRTFFNASRQRTHGVDVDVAYRWSLGAWGRVSASSLFTYMGTLKRQLNPGQPLVELADTWQFPRWRNTTSATWTRGVWSTTWTLNTIGSYEDFYAVGGQPVRLKAFPTLDAQVAYTGIKNLRLSVGGQNVLDREPPFSNADWQGFDTSTHNPRGAYWYGRVNYKF